MRITEIIALPQTIDHNPESLYRSYAILQKVKEWLRANTPSVVILDLIQDMENSIAPASDDTGQTVDHDNPNLAISTWEPDPAATYEIR